MKPSRYGYLARIAYMHSMNEKEICKGKQSIRFIVNLLMSYKKKKILDLPNLERTEKETCMRSFTKLTI